MAGVAQFSLVAIDCADPLALAQFYAALTGWPIAYTDDDWVQLKSDRGATIAFQRAPDHIAPQWPDPARPQQLHLDFDVGDLDGGEARVVALGAVKADHQPRPDDFRVFVDPAGHPFCLVLASGDERS